MQKSTLFLLLPFIVLMVSFSARDKHSLVGHWVTTGTEQAKVDFTKDSFKVTVNGAIQNQGTYTLEKDQFSMYDQDCGMKVAGKYQLTFFNPDSVAFKLMEDPCVDRGREVNGAVIARLK